MDWLLSVVVALLLLLLFVATETLQSSCDVIGMIFISLKLLCINNNFIFHFAKIFQYLN